MEKNNFTSSISANISSKEAIKRISNVSGWWGITFSGSSENQNDEFIVKMGGDSCLAWKADFPEISFDKTRHRL